MAVAGRSYANVPIISRGSLEDPGDFGSRTRVLVVASQPDRRWYGVGPVTVTASRPAPAATAAVTPGPVVVASQPPVRAVAQAFTTRSTLQDPPVLTTAAPVVVAAAVDRRWLAAAPVTVLAAPQAPPPAAVATPGPVVVASPYDRRWFAAGPARVTAAPSAAAAPTGTRSQYTWPFTWDSIWNLPIASTATYATTGITVTSDYSTQGDAAEANSTNPLDPVKTFSNTYAGSKSVYSAAAMTGNGQWNSTCAFLDATDGDTIWQGQTLQLTAGGNPDLGGQTVYQIPGVSITTSTGIIGAHGGSFLSCLGGTLTAADLTGSGAIPHALKFLFNGLLYYSSAGTGFQWPAANADSGYNTIGNVNYYGGSNTHIVEGALLALPPSVNPLTKYSDPLVRRIAVAAQNYGGYIVDNTAAGAGVSDAVVEVNWDAIAHFSGSGTFGSDLHQMLEDLQVVTNSTAATPGGGAIGTARLAAFAPPFAFVGKMATLVDNFATNDLATLWAASYGTVVWSPGQVAVKCDTAYDSGLQAAADYDLTGSSVYANVAPYLATSSATSLQLAANSANNIFCGQTGTLFVVYQTIAGTSTQLFGTTYNATSMAWWRIRESAGTVFVDTSPDGSAWSNQYSFADSTLGFPLTMLTVLFQAGDYGSDPAGTSYVYAVGTAPAAAGPAITTSSLPGAVVGSAYSQVVTATGGTTPYVWSISAGSLPAGLSIAAGSGVISGTPTTAGTSSFTVEVTDAASLTATQPLSIAVALPALVFPAAPLGLTAEMQVNGTWTDLTPWMDHGPVVIGRGHPDESTTVSPSTLEMTLTNSSGEFTSQNPVGPWWPWLKPNIPLRVSIPAATSYLRLEADNQDRAFVNEVSALDITGSLEARIELRPSDWGGAVLAAKWDGAACWHWQLNGDGTMTFGWFDSGASFHTVTSAAAVPMLNAQVALKVTLNASTGQVVFWTAPSIDGTYTQLSVILTGGSTSVATGASPLVVGFSGNFTPSQLLGAVTAFRLYNGIGGTVVADAAFSSLAPGATTWTDGPGRTWHLAGGAEISGRNYRGHFEVPEFPQEEPAYQPDDEDEDAQPDVLCAIAGGGLLRRLGAANTPLASPMRRAYVKLSSTAQAAAPAAYWPMEDLAAATQLASGLGGPAMGVNGPAQLASSTAFACSLALPVVNGATFSGTVPTISSWTDNVVRFLMQIPAAGEANGTVIASVAGTGIISVLQLTYTTASGGSLTLAGYSAIGTQLFTTGAQAFAVNGKLLRVSMNMRQISGDLLYETETLQVGAGSSLFFQGTYTGGAVAAVRSVTLNPGGAAGLTTTVLGHCSVQPVWDTLFDTSGALDAWLGEAAGTRFARLCGEEGIPFRGRGNLAATIAMGAQTAETLSQLLQECADADRGVWAETRQVLGWSYITRAALYNQPAAVTLDHDQDHLSPWTSDPTQDDQALLNDATITATSGSSARAYAAPGQPVTGGRLSNLPPPAGIGVYDSVPTSSVNTAADGDLQRIASWMIWIGTTDQQRFPGISIDLANTAYPYFNATVAMDLGDPLVMASPPPWLGADPVSQLCQGLKETLWAFDYLIEVNGVPETPYEVAVSGSSSVTAARADTPGSTLDGAVTPTGTILLIATTGPAWTTNGAWLPFDIGIGGERMTVTSISGGTPQTFTVIRSVNGVVKSQPNGAAVSLFNSPVAAL